MTEYQISTLYEKIQELNSRVKMFGADLWINFTVNFDQSQFISTSMDNVLETYELAERVLSKLEIPHDGIDYTPDNLSLSIQKAKKSIDYFKFQFYGELKCHKDDLDYNLITEQQWADIPKEFDKLVSKEKLPVALHRIRSKISIIIDWGEKINGYELENESQKLLNSIKPLMLKWGIVDDEIYASGEFIAQQHLNFKPTDCLLFNFYNEKRF